ncbi:pectin acetylesterase-family hydrolase [Butyrivibrio sp. MB2005]|uniref:pectin acetylesterase-family hydrolase n=1 Tax=Butyrivibrio sp. MB2005 TaxID=1280678 RepID=UPI000410EB69|nr:pectin acetylesterase-family hydrolase [Butyrivibrio sp. MB2005]
MGIREKRQIRKQMLELHLGDFVENSIGKRIVEKDMLAPELPEEPEKKVWYRVPVPMGISGDGSEYYIYVKIADPKKLCIFFSGGGVAWNEYTAARPVSGGKVAAALPNYYWNNLRPFTQIMNIDMGIMNMKDTGNPFRDYSIIDIPYATGDFHVGNNEFPYKGEDGDNHVLYFHGYLNFMEGMARARNLFGSPKKLLIAGNSAGAFAVPALTDEILSVWYQGVSDVTVLSDSALLLYKKWVSTAREVWKAPQPICEAIDSDNITLSWYKALYKKYGEKIRYLYSSSTRDYVLSAYYNDVTYKKYATDEDVQKAYFEQLKEMVAELKKITPNFHMFINNWEIPLITKGGTVHTAVREPYFTRFTQDDVTMARWLYDAVNGNLYDVGMELLESD